MLETDTNLDDFKDDMIEVSEDEFEKIAGSSGDGDKDISGNAAKQEELDSQATETDNQSNKKRNIITFIAALIVIGGLVAVFIFTGANNDIVGKWEYKVADTENAYLKDARMIMEFTKDGKIEMEAFVGNVLVSTDAGTYTAKSGYLAIDWEKTGSVDDVEYEITDGKLIFKSSNGKEQVFERIK